MTDEIDAFIEDSRPRCDDAGRAGRMLEQQRDIICVLRGALERLGAVLDFDEPATTTLEFLNGAEDLNAAFKQARAALDGSPSDIVPSRAVARLKAIISHWDEFGPEHGFDEVIDRARS